MKIALVGNPNSGKTTTFNDLTGSAQYVGNWPGVTVEKKEGLVKGYKDVTLVDLPGIYSLSPYTLEEVVSRDVLLHERLDAVINIVDASNLERNLYLTTQVLEMGIPVVVALNMMDVVEKRGDKVNSKYLSEQLGCPVIEISALRNRGVQVLADKAVEVAKKHKANKIIHFEEKIENAIAEISEVITCDENRKRWTAIKIFERDEKVLERTKFTKEQEEKIEAIIGKIEQEEDDDSISVVINGRYEYIESIIKKTIVKKDENYQTVSDKIDKIVTNRFLALPVFFGIIYFIYYISIQTVGDWTIGWIEGIFETLAHCTTIALTHIGTAEWLMGLIVDGIIGGLGSVLVFVPQIMILFFFISLLEDCGYMSRIAFIMDRLFRKFGLSGKSFIPMIIGTGCSVPGIMAARTIENEKDRRMTILLTPFIPCGAKLPVFALFAGAFFPENPFIGPSIYLLGFVTVIICGLILKRTKRFAGEVAPFIMELPEYRVPSMRNTLIQMWQKGKDFIVKAGTIVFAGCGIIWFLSTFSFSMQMVEVSESMLASIGRVIAPIFAPLGFGSWQASSALLTGFVAKENIVATFGILLKVGAESDAVLYKELGTLFNGASAYAFMAFTLLAAPCFAAIGAIKREMNDIKWTLFTLTFQTGVAYVMACIIYNVGKFFI